MASPKNTNAEQPASYLPALLPSKGSQRYLRFSLAAKVAVGEAERLPERAGSWKPSLVLRRRLGCVLPFRGIKQVSPFGLHGLPSL